MRSFTIVSIKNNDKSVRYTDGRFISDSPAAAAKKAFSKAYHYLNGNGPMSLKITMRETTQDSKKKEYIYRVTRKSEKTQIERDGEIITYNFTTKIKSLTR
jgi:hypothetical protein